MAKWITSLVMLVALTGQVWAGVCSCLHEKGDVHSCCKPDNSGKTSMAAKGCCSVDCEAMSTGKASAYKSSRVTPTKVALERTTIESVRLAWSAPKFVTIRTDSTNSYFSHSHTLARPPDALYLRHNSFLI